MGLISLQPGFPSNYNVRALKETQSTDHQLHSCFLRPSLDLWGKGRCSLYATSTRLQIVMLLSDNTVQWWGSVLRPSLACFGPSEICISYQLCQEKHPPFQLQLLRSAEKLCPRSADYNGECMLTSAVLMEQISHHKIITSEVANTDSLWGCHSCCPSATVMVNCCKQSGTRNHQQLWRSHKTDSNVDYNGECMSVKVVLDQVRHFQPIPIHGFFAVNWYRYDTDMHSEQT